MKPKYDVTVIILTYNSQLEKTLSTIKSSFLQEDVSFEVIVSDDGSKINYKDEIIEFSKFYLNVPFKYIGNTENYGIVANVLGAVEKAEGEYTYFISPGDYFFEKRTLKNLIDFVRKNKSEICFGKLQYYCYEDGCVSLINKMNPPAPSVYSNKFFGHKLKTLAYCTTETAVGASFIRKTDVIKEYLNKIKQYSRNDEDNTTSYYHLLKEKKDIDFYSGYVAWYEYGMGISTSNNIQFIDSLKNDCDKVLKMIKSQNSSKSIIDYIQTEDVLHRNLKHPQLFVKWIILKIYCKLFKNREFLKETTPFFNEVQKTSFDS